MKVDNPSQLPDISQIAEVREPVVQLDIVTPDTFTGAVMKLAIERRGRFSKQEYLAIVAQWLSSFGVPVQAIEEARPEALVWALERG